MKTTKQTTMKGRRPQPLWRVSQSWTAATQQVLHNYPLHSSLLVATLASALVGDIPCVTGSVQEDSSVVWPKGSGTRRHATCCHCRLLQLRGRRRRPGAVPPLRCARGLVSGSVVKCSPTRLLLNSDAEGRGTETKPSDPIDLHDSTLKGPSSQRTWTIRICHGKYGRLRTGISHPSET